MIARRIHSFRKPPVVFRRWSRSGYAQFVSMKREVVIAHLKASICYVAMLKQGIMMNDDHSPEVFRRKGADDEDDGPGGSPQLASRPAPTLFVAQQPSFPCSHSESHWTVGRVRNAVTLQSISSFRHKGTRAECRVLTFKG